MLPFYWSRYGGFWPEIGVYVPEIGSNDRSIDRKFVRTLNCGIRGWPLDAATEKQASWRLDSDIATATADVRDRLGSSGLAMLQRLATRDGIVESWIEYAERAPTVWDFRSRVAPIDVALILAKRGQLDQAQALLLGQVQDASHNPYHIEYVRALARKLWL